MQMRQGPMMHQATKNFAAGRHRRGLTSLEWVLLVTVLVIGMVSGLGAIRDSLSLQLTEFAEAIHSIYTPQ